MSEHLAESVALTIEDAKENGLSLVAVNVKLLEATLEKLNEHATLQNQLSVAMSENQRLTKIVEDYEEENDTLKGKLLAIECAGCGKTMLECECDEVE